MLELAGIQAAYVGMDAFASIADAVAAVSRLRRSDRGQRRHLRRGSTGGRRQRHAAAGAGSGQQPADVTLQNLTGDAGDAIATRYYNAANANLIVEQGSFAGAISGTGSSPRPPPAR